MTQIPTFSRLSRRTGLAVACLSLVALQGCMAGKVAKVGSAIGGAASTVVSTVGGAAGSAAGAAARAAGSAGSSGGSSVIPAAAAAGGATTLAAPAQSPAVTEMSLSEASANPVQTTYVEAPYEAVSDALKQCMQRIDVGDMMVANASAISLSYRAEKDRPKSRTTVLSAATPDGGTSFEEVTATPGDEGKPLLTGTVSPGKSCTLNASQISMANTRAIAYATLEDLYPGALRVGRPSGATGPCDGFTLSLLDGRNLWLRFTDDTGADDSCTPDSDTVHLVMLAQPKDA